MLISGFAAMVNRALQDGLSEFKRYTDKDTLRAAVASATLTGWADGSFDPNEKRKAMAVLTKHPAMAHFKTTDITAVWGELDGVYMIDPTMGDDQAVQWISAARAKPEPVRRVIGMIGCAVAGADDNFDANEVRKVKATCIALGLTPSTVQPLVTAAEKHGIAL
ncbi:MAG: tellurite resistance TerB family protein [Parcubacteria group bacterium]|nr:tellurite resistance TerB family protein [Parcubacteria group bacterium]